MRRLSLRNQRPRLRLGAITSGILASGISTPYTPLEEFTASEGAWWDFTDTDTLFQDVAGTTPCTTAGHTVALVVDKSGNGHNLTQSTAGFRPTLRQNTNGTFYLEFDGSNDYLSCSSTGLNFMHDGTGSQVTVAGKIRSVAGTTYIMANQTFSTAGIGYIMYSATTSKIGAYSANGVDAVLSGDSGDGVYPQDMNQVITTMYVTDGGGTDLAFRKDGTQYATLEDAAVPSGSNATSDLYIGSSVGASANCPMDLYSICIVERATVSTDLETYVRDQMDREYLDNLATTPQAAYGLSKLVSTATNAIRVRRSSDSTEQDIGFWGNELDYGSLITFVGAGSGYITKYYNQVGNSQPDLVQATTTDQPAVVSSGVHLYEGTFDGTDDGMQAPSFTFGTPQVGVYSKIRCPNTVDSLTHTLFEQGSNGTTQAFSHYYGSTNVLTLRSDNTTAIYRQFNYLSVSSKTALTPYTILLDRSIAGTGEMLLYQSGSLQAETITSSANEQTGNYNNNNLNVGARNNAASNFAAMGLKNLAIYTADTASIRTSIEAIIDD